MEDSEKIQYITNEITEIHRRGVSFNRLGDIALQIIVARRDAEEIMEGNYPKKQKESAEKELKRLKEIEKGLIYLYMNAIAQNKSKRLGEAPLIFRMERF